jgi:large subunit ribosomal protein L25
MSNIQATKRDPKENLATLRAEGNIPAVFYGAGKTTTSVSVPEKAFLKLWKEAGESSTIGLTLDGTNIDALIHEVQFDPVKGTPLHVDFLVVDMNKPIEVSVPLEFVGVSGAVKSGAGTLVKVMHELEVSALPKNIPHAIEVDLSKLATLDDQVKVEDLALPAGVTAIAKGSEVVASVAVQKEEKEEPTAPIDLSTIEVEKKGKKEEEAPAAE